MMMELGFEYQFSQVKFAKVKVIIHNHYLICGAIIMMVKTLYVNETLY